MQGCSFNQGFPGQGTKIPHTSWPKNQKVKQKQYCNKLNKDIRKIKLWSKWQDVNIRHHTTVCIYACMCKYIRVTLHCHFFLMNVFLFLLSFKKCKHSVGPYKWLSIKELDAFKLWCWIRLLRIPWTARRSNLSILKEINPEYSLERLMPKPQYLVTWCEELTHWKRP